MASEWQRMFRDWWWLWSHLELCPYRKLNRCSKQIRSCIICSTRSEMVCVWVLTRAIPLMITLYGDVVLIIMWMVVISTHWSLAGRWEATLSSCHRRVWLSLDCSQRNFDIISYRIWHTLPPHLVSSIITASLADPCCSPKHHTYWGYWVISESLGTRVLFSVKIWWFKRSGKEWAQGNISCVDVLDAHH